MIDDFAMLLTHVLLAVTCWRLAARSDLDFNAAPDAPAAPGPETPADAAAPPVPSPALRPVVPALNIGGGRRA